MNFQKIGFAFSNLASNQITFTTIKSCNKHLENNFDTNINLFFEENYIPCIDPRFARFHLKDAYTFDGHLIATNVKIAKIIRNFARPKRYYYIQDLENLRKHVPIQDWLKVMVDDRIIKFCRSEDHRNELVSQGFQIDEKIVVDSNIVDILEIIKKYDNKTN